MRHQRLGNVTHGYPRGLTFAPRFGLAFVMLLFAVFAMRSYFGADDPPNPGSQHVIAAAQFDNQAEPHAEGTAHFGI